MNRLIDICQPLVTAQAARCVRSRSDVEDIVQDVWECLIAHAPSIRDPETLVGWLITVTRRAAMSHTRRARRTVPGELDDRPSTDDVDDEVVQRFSRAETVAGIGDALGRLSEADRRLLILLHRSRRPSYELVGQSVGRPTGSLGPTRSRLLSRLQHDPSVRQLRVVA
jgi:RNA polymerase sigma factor (sigma-70 family)